MIEELERLERAATPGPWQELAESGAWWVEGAEGIGVCESNEAWNHQGDINLMIAARNALPALLRVARAARKWIAVQREYEAWHDDESRPASDGDGIVEEMDAAYNALGAALAALEAL